MRYNVTEKIRRIFQSIKQAAVWNWRGKSLKTEDFKLSSPHTSCTTIGADTLQDSQYLSIAI